MMNFLKKSNGDALSRASKKNFSFSPSILQLATFTSLIAFAAMPARADYYDAKIHFQSLSADDQSKAILGLESTGDFNGLTLLGYTERFYKAILTFETKNNLEVDGKLQPLEIDRLDSEGHILFDQVGFKDYKNEKVGSTLLVPHKLFDSEVAIENGINFQRVDKGYSLSFVSHTNDQSTFENLFEVIRTPSDIRAVDYQKIRDNFFVVTGTNKGRKFYTYMERIPSGTTGFTLTWRAENSILAGKLVTILANTFIATPEAKAPAVEPQQPQTVAATQGETIVETPLIRSATTVSDATIAATSVAPTIIYPQPQPQPLAAPTDSLMVPNTVPQPQAAPVVQFATTLAIPQQPIEVQPPQPIAASVAPVAPQTTIAEPFSTSNLPDGEWKFDEKNDEMRDEKTYFETVVSQNKLDFDFPYNGGSDITLVVRHGNTPEFELLLVVSKGIFDCKEYLQDTIAVKFDSRPVEKYKCGNSSIGNSNVLHIEDVAAFMYQLKTSNKLVVEAPFYQAGKRQVSFNISGYKSHISIPQSQTLPMLPVSATASEQTIALEPKQQVTPLIETAPINVSASTSKSGSTTAATIGDTIVGLLGFWTITIFLMYWLPTVVAISRKNRSLTAIIVLNFFIGWTGIGWIVLLVWAFSNPPMAEGVTYIDINNLHGARKI
jgi:Superinfection immunity protein